MAILTQNTMQKSLYVVWFSK